MHKRCTGVTPSLCRLDRRSSEMKTGACRVTWRWMTAHACSIALAFPGHRVPALITTSAFDLHLTVEDARMKIEFFSLAGVTMSAKANTDSKIAIALDWGHELTMQHDLVTFNGCCSSSLVPCVCVRVFDRPLEEDTLLEPR